MKTDKEFLDGVYAKIHQMEQETGNDCEPEILPRETREKSSKIPRRALWGSALAAAVAIVCIPLGIWLLPPVQPAEEEPSAMPAPATYGLDQRTIPPQPRTVFPYQNTFRQAAVVVKLEQGSGKPGITKVWKQAGQLDQPAWQPAYLAGLIKDGVPKGHTVILFLSEEAGEPVVLDVYAEQAPEVSGSGIEETSPIYVNGSGDSFYEADLVE